MIGGPILWSSSDAILKHPLWAAPSLGFWFDELIGQLVVKETQVSTDLFGRGIDIERVNIVINYDMPDESIQAALGVADQLIRQTVMQETHRIWIWLKVRWKT